SCFIIRPRQIMYPLLLAMAVVKGFAPSHFLEDFITEHKIVINFWNYLDRMSIYRTLLNATSSYIYKTESKIMRNVLWGLPLQHGWQYQTGRLGDTANVNNTKQQSLDPTISPRSWWACMNYYLCAIPFLGAVDAGLFNNFPHEIELTQPEEFPSDFCSGVTDCKISCPEAMAQWKAFFENSRQVAEQSSLNNSEEEGIVSLMWKAHVESIRIALPICSKRLNYLSAPERNFGRNWAKAVEFLAAAYFPTDFESVNNFQMYLPPRRLKEGDKAPNIADFGMEQNRIVFALDWLNKANIFSGRLLVICYSFTHCFIQ
uniref:Chromosome 6 open reading frame 58 n=1 Tax=Leptobrachium leishanense TaxID=445787 RepID=A0A8C5PGC1_9ANUR